MEESTTKVLLTEETIPAYKEYLDLTAQIKALNEQLKKAKSKILALHQASGVDKISDKGYNSTLVHATRESLVREAIEAKFGPLPPDCIKSTSYDQLKVYLSPVV